MADNVLITPASRKIDFYDASNNVDATIELNSSGDLVITNPGGDISLGDTTADVYIGDGTNNIDIVFEQNGEIRGLTGVTLTLGQTDSTVAVNALSFVINSNTTIRDPNNTDNYMLMYIESGTTNIADSFADTTTAKKYIYFSNPDGSNDPGYIMHETSDSETNEGVLHLVPTDDNSGGDYVSIHGTNDPDVIKLHTSGLIETAGYRLELKSGSSSVYINDSVEITGALTANGGNGTAGQVLTTSGSGIYWSTISIPANTSLSSASWADANNTLTFTRADSSTTDVQISFSEYVNPANTSLSSASWADANNTLTFTRADSSTTDVQISFSEYVNPANTSTSSATYTDANTTLTFTRANATTYDVDLSSIDQLPPSIHIQNTTGTATAGGVNAIAIGAGVYAAGDESIAINGYVPAFATNAISIGHASAASANDSIGIGNRARATSAAPGGIAIGQWANTLASNGVAIGSYAVVAGTEGGVALGKAAYVYSNDSIAIGTSARTQTGVIGGVAIGLFANSIASNGVAIGSYAKVNGANGAVALGWFANANIANTVTLGSPVHDVQINRALYANGGVGTAGQVLLSAGSGANAYWGDASGGGASVSISTSPPGSPSDGDLWWDSDQGVLRIYYADPDSNQWVDAVPQGTGGGGGGALSDLSDVTITSVQNNDLLKYNSTAGEWQNTNLGISIAPTFSILTSPVYVAGAVTANITNHASYDAPAYFAEVRYANGTVLIQNSSITKDNVNGEISFNAPTVANNYKLAMKTQDFGDLESEETVTSFTVSNLPAARYWRVYGSGGSDHTMVTNMELWTGAGQSGNSYPLQDMTSNTTPTPYVASGSGNYNSASYEPWKTFDSNETSSGWWNLAVNATYANWYVQLDLGSNVQIISAEVRLNAAYYGFNQTLTIKGSTTGAWSGEEFTLGSNNSNGAGPWYFN